MGPGKKPSTYRASSMNNLAQFNHRPEEFTKHLKDEKGMGIGSNVNAVYVAVIVVIALVAIISPPYIEKLENRYNKKNEFGS